MTQETKGLIVVALILFTGSALLMWGIPTLFNHFYTIETITTGE